MKKCKFIYLLLIVFVFIFTITSIGNKVVYKVYSQYYALSDDNKKYVNKDDTHFEVYTSYYEFIIKLYYNEAEFSKRLLKSVSYASLEIDEIDINKNTFKDNVVLFVLRTDPLYEIEYSNARIEDGKLIIDSKMISTYLSNHVSNYVDYLLGDYIVIPKRIYKSVSSINAVELINQGYKGSKYKSDSYDYFDFYDSQLLSDKKVETCEFIDDYNLLNTKIKILIDDEFYNHEISIDFDIFDKEIYKNYMVLYIEYTNANCSLDSIKDFKIEDNIVKIYCDYSEANWVIKTYVVFLIIPKKELSKDVKLNHTYDVEFIRLNKYYN